MKKAVFIAALIAAAVLTSVNVSAQEYNGTPDETLSVTTADVTDENEVTSSDTTADVTDENEVTSSDTTTQSSTDGDTPYDEESNIVMLLDSTQSSADYVGISIDGYYDDWSDKPYSKVQYPWDEDNRFHRVTLFRDEGYVYLHVRMSELSYTTFNGNNYRFTVDGVETYVVAVPPDQIQISDNGNTPLLVRAQNGYAVIDGASGMLTRYKGSPDEWELKIPVSFFTPSPETVTSISFYCSNLGDQSVTAVGTSTMPFILAAAGLALAAAGYVRNKKKRDSE